MPTPRPVRPGRCRATKCHRNFSRSQSLRRSIMATTRQGSSSRLLRPRSIGAWLAFAGFVLSIGSHGAGAATLDRCSAQSGATVPTVVELYTSEGCSSCPPADRWLSGLKARDGVVALAFHVDYWDSLGWKDRFAQPQFTQRQNATQHTSGARFAYTPQVIVDGRDAPNWPGLQGAALQGKMVATVGLKLAHDASGLALTVSPGAGAPAKLSGCRRHRRRPADPRRRWREPRRDAASGWRGTRTAAMEPRRHAAVHAAFHVRHCAGAGHDAALGGRGHGRGLRQAGAGRHAGVRTLKLAKTDRSVRES